MSLYEYLKEQKIDEIKNEYRWTMAQHEAIHEYCRVHNYKLSKQDIDFVIDRGFENTFRMWKEDKGED